MLSYFRVCFSFQGISFKGYDLFKLFCFSLFKFHYFLNNGHSSGHSNLKCEDLGPLSLVMINRIFTNDKYGSLPMVGRDFSLVMSMVNGGANYAGGYRL